MTCRPTSRLLFLCLAATTACASEPDDSALQAPPDPIFTEIEYHFVGGREEVDDGGWLLLWEGPMTGDLDATARWFFQEPNPIPDLAVDGGSIAYYQARWEIVVGGVRILAGRSAGKTVTHGEEDGIWDGRGVVTEASDAYRAYLGRQTYETGPVIYSDEETDAPWGRGLFTIH